MLRVIVETTNPYEAMIGAAWALLPAGVRRSHTPPLTATGTMQIIGAGSGFGRLMAQLMKLPPAGESVDTSLDVVHGGNIVTWSRCFGTLRLSSAQVVRKSSFVERAGPFGFVIQPVAAMDALIFRQVGFRVFGLPFPQWLGPRIQGKVASGASDTSWDLDVTIDSRLGGCLCRYFGTMTAQ